MDNPYETDIVAWADEQARLLRQRASNALDWDNIAEEIADVGNSETNGVVSQMITVMRHKLCLIGWPNHLAVNHWQAELPAQLIRIATKHRNSMRRQIESEWPDMFHTAVLDAIAHMVDTGPPEVPLPVECPWTQDELLAESDAVRHRSEEP